MHTSEVQNNEKKLIALKTGVLNRRHLLDRDKERISHPFPESLDDQATSSSNDEVVNELDIQDSSELQDINDALKRIKNGNFGICASCGDEISKKRLEAMPYAKKCIDCESGNNSKKTEFSL